MFIQTDDTTDLAEAEDIYAIFMLKADGRKHLLALPSANGIVPAIAAKRRSVPTMLTIAHITLTLEEGEKFVVFKFTHREEVSKEFGL